MALNRPSTAFSNKTDVNPSVNRQQEATAADFIEAGGLFEEYATAIEALQNASSANPYYNSYTSLSALQSAHPTALTDGWAIIDSGVGVTPQVAAWDDGDTDWQLTNSNSEVHIFVTNEAALPSTGLEQKDYITLNDMLVRVWNDGQYKIKSPITSADSWMIKQVKTKDTSGNTNAADADDGKVLAITDNTNITGFILDAAFTSALFKTFELYNLGNNIRLSVRNARTGNILHIKIVRPNGIITDDIPYIINIEPTILDAEIEVGDNLQFFYVGIDNSGDTSILPLQKVAVNKSDFITSEITSLLDNEFLVGTDGFDTVVALYFNSTSGVYYNIFKHLKDNEQSRNYRISAYNKTQGKQIICDISLIDEQTSFIEVSVSEESAISSAWYAVDDEIYFGDIEVLDAGGATPDTTFYQNRIDKPKTTADTIDDDFNLNALDSKWTVSSGVVGEVDLLAETLTEDEAIIDMFSDSNSLLVQVAEGKNFEISQDFTLGDGKMVVLSASVPMQLTQTLPNFLRAGISIGDGGDAQTNDYFALMLASKDDTWWITREINGTKAGGLGDGADEPFMLGQKIYFAIARKDNTYQGFFSSDGTSWVMSNYFFSLTFTSPKLYLFATSEDTQAGSPLPIVNFDWVREGEAKLLPWNNEPTAPPVIISSAIDVDNSNVVVKTNTEILSSDLITSNFTLTYTQNSDTATNVVISSITNIDGTAISANTKDFLINLTVTGTSNGLGTITIVSSALDDAFSNGSAATSTETLTLYDTSEIYAWKSGDGDNDSSAPYTKTDQNNSVVLTSVGTVEPVLNGDDWDFISASGFKTAETDILDAFNALNRACQIHYIGNFPTTGGSNRLVTFSDDVNNKYYNFFYTSSGIFNLAIGTSSGSTLIIGTGVSVVADQNYLFSIRFYQDGADTKMDASIHDGTKYLYNLEGQLISTPSIVSTGMYWGMRAQNGSNTYYESTVSDCIVSTSSDDYNKIRKYLKSKI